jgi:RNA polymerase sigma factor (sigma-70 family)
LSWQKDGLLIDIAMTRLYGANMAAYEKLADPELIAKCLEHDAEAWEVLIRRYQRLVASITHKYGLPAEDASDILQSVFMTLFQQLAALRKQDKLSSWIITVTVRECHKLRRRPTPTESLDNPAREPLGEPAEPGAQAESLLVLEKQHFIRQAVAQLPEPCRNLLTALFYREEPTPYAEISRQFGIPVASIGPTRGRCLARLKISLKKIGFF